MKTKGLTEQQYLKMARILAEGPSRSHLERWWKHFEEAEAFKAENGHCQLPGNNPLYWWQKRTREQWGKGALDDGQIAALKRLGIERIQKPSANTGPPPGKGPKISQMRELQKKVDQGQVADDDKKSLERLKMKFRNHYNSGSRSVATARQLGFKVGPGRLIP